MEEYDYIERRNQIRAKKRIPRQKKQSYFMLKLNMALALGVTVLCAKIIDLDVTNAFVDKTAQLVTISADTGDIKARILGLISHFDSSSEISVFAGEKRPITMDEELIAQMQAQESAYENAQKKTP